jgi:hypothetical protein
VILFVGSLQAILALRQQSSDVAKPIEHRRSRRKSIASTSKDYIQFHFFAMFFRVFLAYFSQRF